MNFVALTPEAMHQMETLALSQRETVYNTLEMVNKTVGAQIQMLQGGNSIDAISGRLLIKPAELASVILQVTEDNNLATKEQILAVHGDASIRRARQIAAYILKEEGPHYGWTNKQIADAMHRTVNGLAIILRAHDTAFRKDASYRDMLNTIYTHFHRYKK